MSIRNLQEKTNTQNTPYKKYNRGGLQNNQNQNKLKPHTETKIAEDQQKIKSYQTQNNKIFQEKQQLNSYNQYKVKPNDSLIGISLKLNISQKSIKLINEFSGDTIFPGMILNLPSNCDLSLLEESPKKKPQERPKISQLFQIADEKKKVQKYDVYYCSANHNIRGLLTLNLDYIMFNPDIQDEQNRKALTIQKLLKFNAIIQIQDVKQVLTLDIPEMVEDTQQPKTAHIIQLLLYRVGNKKLQEKYKQRLNQLKIDKKAIASVSFKVIQTSEKQIGALTNIIKQQINQSLLKEQEQSQIQKNKQKGLTNITYFDILYTNIIIKKDSMKLKADELKQRISQIQIKMIDQSMLPHQVFLQIAVHFPLIYQLHNWSKFYDCLKDGTSFNTMIRNCQHQDPLLIIIKQYKGRTFGAFLTDQLEFGRTGKGEMFIWSYNQQTKAVNIFKWTTKNQFFVLIDSDGMGIGMGSKYGIYLDANLQKGFSAATQTFGNTEPLSQNQDFIIQNIQVWGLQSTYY